MDGLVKGLQGLFISGTDTDVGKTVITSGLLTFLNAYGIKSYGVKPVCCGGTEDLDAISAVNPTPLKEEILNPLYLPEPAAPFSLNSITLPLRSVLKPIKELNAEMVIVEGAGGWKVPVCKDWDMEALAVSLNFPVILVIANRLGCLNHALLTAESIMNKGVKVAGFFLNTLHNSEYTHALETNKAVLEALLPCPCLGEIPIGGGTCSSEAFSSVLKIPYRPDLRLHFYPSYS